MWFRPLDVPYPQPEAESFARKLMLGVFSKTPQGSKKNGKPSTNALSLPLKQDSFSLGALGGGGSWVCFLLEVLLRFIIVHMVAFTAQAPFWDSQNTSESVPLLSMLQR